MVDGSNTQQLRQRAGVERISVLMIGPAMDEVLSSLQYLRRVHDQGASAWKALWGR